MNTTLRHRRLNVNEPGHGHELTFSCLRGYSFLKAERCCRWLADAIDAAREDLDFDVWAYVFMPEHVHLIIRPRRMNYDIARIRSSIKLPVSRKAVAFLRRESLVWLNCITARKRRERRHRFWQKGGAVTIGTSPSRGLWKK